VAGPLSSSPVFIVAGVSHATAPLGLRDRLFVDDDEVGPFLASLPADTIDGAVALSTCDRVEVIACGADGDRIVSAIKRALVARLDGHGVEAFAETCYALDGEDAIRHLFRVSASLESQVIGEPQVLGQVKAAHRLAKRHGEVPAALEAVLQAAYAAAKRVRTETAIGERPVSIAAAAAQAARDVHGDLSSCRALLIGDGDMGSTIMETLIARGLGASIVTHPSPERAQSQARQIDAHVTPFTALSDALGDADIVVTALGGRQFALSADMTRRVVAQRPRRPMLIIDLAVPGDVEPAVDRLDDAYLFDLGDLDAMAMDGASSRESEAPKASAIVEDALGAFLRSDIERTAAPALVRLRRYVEGIRDDVLAEAGNDAEKATRLMANRLLHHPSVRLRALASEDGAEALADAERILEILFGDGPGAARAGDEDGEPE